MAYYPSTHQRSHSHQGHSPSYYYPSPASHQSQQPIYYSHSDSGHRRYNSIGASGGQTYYAPQSPYQRGRTYSASYQGQSSPAQYLTVPGSHRRNRSTTASPVVIDVRRQRHGNAHAQRARSSSAYRPASSSHSRNYSDRSRRYSESNLSFGDRLRRMFGLGPWAHQNSSHHNRGRERYVDARTGRETDRWGRPIYRV